MRNMKFALTGLLGTAISENPVFTVQKYLLVNKCADCGKFFVEREELDRAAEEFLCKLNDPENDPHEALDSQVQSAVGGRTVGQGH